MKRYLLVVLLFSWKLVFSQLTEDFADGNINTNPAWTGSNASGDFVVISDQLRSNSTAANSNFYLSTANSLAAGCIWEFYCNLQFNTSGSNYADVYLASDQADLQSSNINGYFVRIGNTDDEISLYKRTGARSSSVKIIDGINGSVGTSNNTVKIKITRTAANVFTLDRDLTGTGSSYFTEGSATDSQITTSSHFGIYIQQSTSSFFQKHFFDAIRISTIVTDTTPPELISAKAVDSLTVDVVFSEDVDSVTAKNPANFLLSGLNHPASITLISTSKYRLHYNTSLQTAAYTLTVSNVRDLHDNIMNGNQSTQFNFTKPYEAKKNDIAINEIFADPSPQVDLPGLEFIELWNTTDKVINLKNWKYSDQATTYTFGNDSLQAGEYLILCARADTLEFKKFGRVIGISPWPSLNNAGDVIKLVSDKNIIINEIAYNDSWYKDPVKKQGGYTLERIDPLSKCEGLFNWIGSADISGGTPGKVNSVYFLNYDLLQFKADSLKQPSDTTLKVWFNKPVDRTSITSDKFIINPAFASVKMMLLDTEGKQLTLVYPEKFTPATHFSLTVQSLRDCSGNIISGANQPFEFITTALPPIRVDTARIFITEFLADPSPEVGLPLAEFVEIYNPGKDTIDLHSWSLNDPAVKATIRNTAILPGQYAILCPVADTTQYKVFGKVIGLSPWPSFNNSSDQIILKSFKDRMIDSVAYNDTWYKDVLKKGGGWSLERIDPLSKCQGSSAWGASKDIAGGTPGKVNSIYFKDYDLLDLHADSLQRSSDSTVIVYFNKVIDQASLTTEKFTLSPAAGVIANTALNSELNQATLTFSQQFEPGTNYTLTARSIQDCGGKAISNVNQLLQFTTPALPPPPPVRSDTARVFITEIFADPSPEVGLPLAEFVEIYNPGKDTIDLHSWSLNDPAVKATIRNTAILPGQYAILCPVADTTQYKVFGKVIGLSPWPSFNNSSDQIILKSFKDRTVDSVSYNDTWYKDVSKKGGGWSLERIDPLSKCQGSSAWGASKDIAGGTPGKVNSIYHKDYDLVDLHADSLKRFSDSTVIVYFNKVIDKASLSPEKFTLSPAAGVIANTALNSELNQATLTFSQQFEPGTNYTLTARSIQDCGGKAISNVNQPLQFTTPALPLPPPVRSDTAKILITEIFADPSPEVGLPLSEFVEIYNPGKDTVDLDSWTLCDPTAKATIRKSSILPKQYVILCPAADTLQYKAFGKVIGLSPWPSLNNSSDQVVLKSFKNRTIDSVAYNDTWYKDTAKKRGGWTLECIDQSQSNKWYSWSASSHGSGGTPGQMNSVSDPEVRNTALKIDSVRVLSDSTLRVWFNVIQDTSFLRPLNFKVNTHPAASIKISEDFRTATLEFNEHFMEGNTYALIAEELRTCSGVVILYPGNQSDFSIRASPELAYPIVINEIFADTSPVAGLPDAEFIELFNPTDQTVLLEGLSYEDGTTKYHFSSGSIEPGGYLILCPVKDTLNYKPFGKVFGLDQWPGLNNDRDILLLRNNKGKEIYRVSYDVSWHKDKAKQPGGWSLELIDPAAVCSGKQNWASSIDPFGGTPGKANSVYKLNANVEPLKLLACIPVDSVTVQLKFSRMVDSLSASLISKYTMNNGIGNPVKATVLSPDFTQVSLRFSNPVTRDNTYNIIAENITDCAGSVIAAGKNSAEFFFPKRITAGDILINEILFNPRSQGADFVEIYNNSKSTLDLKDLSIATKKDSLTSIIPLCTSLQLFPPGKYLVLSTDPDNIKKEYMTEDPGAFLKMPSMPSFNDNAGVVVLVSDKMSIDELVYSDKMHFKLIKDAEGVSLERSSLVKPAGEPGNFRSAAASAGYATPGYRNSQYLETVAADDAVFLSSKTISPDNDGFEDVLQLNYKFSEPGWIADVNIYNVRGALIKKVASSHSLAVSGTLYWDGLTEINEVAPVGIYVMYVEIFDLQGHVKKYKRSFAIAAKLGR